jgi:hypothetical protein
MMRYRRRLQQDSNKGVQSDKEDEARRLMNAQIGWTEGLYSSLNMQSMLDWAKEYERRRNGDAADGE